MPCKALTTENTNWEFCPSPGASILFTLLFGATTCLHILQAVYHRAWYSWVIVVSGLLQVATYLFRDLSIKYPANETYYVLWFVLILIASVWTNAYVYMVFSRMLWRYHPRRSIFRLKAWHYGTTFVILDIFAFIVQIAGAAKAANPKATMDEVMSGLHIYMGGVGIQQIFIFGFCVIVLRFLWDVSRQRDKMNVSPALVLGWTLIGALFFITVRIIFRLIEYANGLKSSIPNHEGWQYGLDSLPMLIALVLFNIFHPGRLMPSHEVKIPSFFERRRQRKQGVDLEKNPNLQNARY